MTGAGCGVTLSLRGKCALVTGGSGGIGSAVVALLAQAGADVLNIDRPGCRAPANATTLECDLACPAAVRTLGDRIAAEHPRLDALVHCAGITRDGVLWKLSDQDWSEVLTINLDSAFHLLRAFVPCLREAGGGSVVLVSSINGERGKFGQSNYAASKAGLIALGKSAALELGRFGIRVNAVAPGMIDTPMTAQLDKRIVENAVAQTATGRIGSPQDVAGAVLFLCSELASHVTGQVLRVDGGQCTV